MTDRHDAIPDPAERARRSWSPRPAPAPPSATAQLVEDPPAGHDTADRPAGRQQAA